MFIPAAVRTCNLTQLRNFLRIHQLLWQVNIPTKTRRFKVKINPSRRRLIPTPHKQEWYSPRGDIRPFWRWFMMVSCTRDLSGMLQVR
jgi:hypothetical protein